MKTQLRFSFACSILCLCHQASAQTPQNYLYTTSGEIIKVRNIIERNDIKGVQIIYNWKELERNKNEYDFSTIQQDLNYLSMLNKKLFIQIQDRFFEPNAKNVPDYLLNEKIYNGGIVAQSDNPGENKPAGSGWVTQQWNPFVQQRFQKLLEALAQKFDGLIFGINLPETSIDINMEHDTTGFSCEKYFEAEISNLIFARKMFKKSHVVQYVNFFPCEWNNDHQFMSRLFTISHKNKIGLGGPDIIPDKQGQMKNSYPFFNKYKGRLTIVAMAIQEPTLTYTNPKTQKPFTKDEFVKYAENYLGVNIIFWAASSPWLQ